MSTFELVAALVTLLAVYLTARQVIWCWPLGLVSVSMYALVFYQARLYADMGLQALYFVLSIYGWWAWLHGGAGDTELRVTTASWATRGILLGVGLLGGVGLGAFLARFTDASLPYLDSTLTLLSIVAQIMQTRKWLETWILWIGVDVVYVGMFLFKGLHPTAGLYALFLVLAVMGFREWRDAMHAGSMEGVTRLDAPAT